MPCGRVLIGHTCQNADLNVEVRAEPQGDIPTWTKCSAAVIGLAVEPEIAGDAGDGFVHSLFAGAPGLRPEGVDLRGSLPMEVG